jgi:hypothetical protein
VALIEEVREERQQEERHGPVAGKYERWARWRLRVLGREQYARDWSRDPATQIMAVFRRNLKWIAAILALAGWLQGLR